MKGYHKLRIRPGPAELTARRRQRDTQLLMARIDAEYRKVATADPVPSVTQEPHTEPKDATQA